MERMSRIGEVSPQMESLLVEPIRMFLDTRSRHLVFDGRMGVQWIRNHRREAVALVQYHDFHDWLMGRGRQESMECTSQLLISLWVVTRYNQPVFQDAAAALMCKYEADHIYQEEVDGKMKLRINVPNDQAPDFIEDVLSLCEVFMSHMGRADALHLSVETVAVHDMLVLRVDADFDPTALEVATKMIEWLDGMPDDTEADVLVDEGFKRYGELCRHFGFVSTQSVLTDCYLEGFFQDMAEKKSRGMAGEKTGEEVER